MSDLKNKSEEQLMDLFVLAKTPGEKQAIKDEMKSRMTQTVAASTAAPTVEFNSAGGVYIRDYKPRSLAKSGNLYNGSANLDCVMARYLCSDDPESVELRRAVMALLNSPQSERERAIATKAADKADKKTKEIAAARAVIEKSVKSGLISATALAEFDAKQAESAAPTA